MRLLNTCAYVLILSLVVTACAPFLAAPAPTTAAVAAAPQALAPASLNTQVVEATPTVVETATVGSFILEFTPVPTDTPLPTLELPTEAARPPALQVWDGLPTYPAESKPDFYFRLRFDPGVWALTTDNYGFPALGHRSITNCIVSPTTGRGMPLNGTAEHEVRRIGVISFQITSAFVNGIKQFVTYAAGDGNIYTAFEVTFQDNADQCLSNAETVMGTLRSVPISQAAPLATP